MRPDQINDEPTFFRCWRCDCFFPQWFTLPGRHERLCHAHNELAHWELFQIQPAIRQLAPWSLVTAIRWLAALEATQRARSD